MPYIGNIVQDFSVNNAMLNTDSVTSIKIDDGTIVNADINDSAAIAGTKIDPDFGSQGITTTGAISMGNGLTLTGTNPFIDIVDSNNNSDFTVKNDNGTFEIEDKTNSNAVRLAIDSSGNVGIGTNSPSNNLEVASADHTGILIQSNRTTASDNIGALDFRSSSTDVARIQSLVDGTIKFRNTSALNERLRIDSSGRILTGHSSARADVGQVGSPQIQHEGLVSNDSSVSIIRNSASNFAGSLILGKSRGTSVGSNTIVQDGDQLGTIRFAAADGTDVNSEAAFIQGRISGTPGSNDTPGKLFFATTADGAASATERMVIDASGKVGIGITSPEDLLHIKSGKIRIENAIVSNNDSTISYDNQELLIDVDANNVRGSSAFHVKVDGTLGLVVDDNRRVLIGQSSSDQSTSMLQVKRANNSIIRVASSDATATNFAAVDFAPANSIAGARISAVAVGTFGSTSSETAYLKFDTRNAGTTAERMRIHSSGIVTVGNDASGAATYGGQMVIATTSGGVLTCADTGSGERLRLEGGSGLGRIGTDSNHDLVFITNGTSNERMRITSAGRLLIGTTTASSAGNSQYSLFEVSGNTSGAASAGHLTIKRGVASASTSNGDTLGRLIFSGLDGGDFAFIQASVDADTTNDFPGRLMFWTCADGATSPTERMRIDHSGKVGINNTSLNADLSVSNSSQNSAFVDIGQAGGNRFKLGYEGNNCFFGGTASTAMFIFKNNVTQSENPQASGNERMRIDGYGRLMVGTTTSTSNQSGRLNVFGTDGDSAFVSIRRGSDNASGPRFAMCKSRNTTDGAASGLVQDGDILGTIHFYANDSQGFEEGAAIQAVIDGTPGSNDVPTRLSFQTTPDGSDTKQERMRIKQDGNIAIGKTSNFGNGGTTGIELNGGSH